MYVLPTTRPIEDARRGSRRYRDGLRQLRAERFARRTFGGERVRKTAIETLTANEDRRTRNYEFAEGSGVEVHLKSCRMLGHYHAPNVQERFCLWRRLAENIFQTGILFCHR